MTRARAGSVAALALAASVITACGSGGAGGGNPTGMSPSALGKAVGSAMTHATSVHLVAKVTQSGKPIGMDVTMTRSGEIDGTMSMDGHPFTILATGRYVYVKGSRSFFAYAHIPASACAAICGKYLKMSAASASSFTGSAGWSKVVAPIGASVPALTYAGTATVAGQSAWKVRVSGGGTAYIAVAAPHYLLRLEQGSDHFDFSEWNSAVIPPPPPARKVVDLSKLTG